MEIVGTGLFKSQVRRPRVWVADELKAARVGGGEKTVRSIPTRLAAKAGGGFQFEHGVVV